MKRRSSGAQCGGRVLPAALSSPDEGPRGRAGTAGVAPAFNFTKERAGRTRSQDSRSAQSIQRKHEQIARRFEIVVLDRVQVATAALHRDILVGADRVGDGRAL